MCSVQEYKYLVDLVLVIAFLIPLFLVLADPFKLITCILYVEKNKSDKSGFYPYVKQAQEEEKVAILFQSVALLNGIAINKEVEFFSEKSNHLWSL